MVLVPDEHNHDYVYRTNVMVVLDGASAGIGAIWYRMKLVLEKAESWYQMNAKVVLDHYRVLDDMECGYRMNVQVPYGCRTFWYWMTWSIGWPAMRVPEHEQYRYRNMDSAYIGAWTIKNMMLGHRNIALNHHRQNYYIIILLVTKNMKNYVLTT